LAYPALCEPYFAFMEVMFKQHLAVLLEVEPSAFWLLISSLQEGLGSFSLACSTYAASSLDFMLVSFIEIQQKVSKLSSRVQAPIPAVLTAQHKAISALLSHKASLNKNGGKLLHDMFVTLISIFLFDHPANQFTLSRPIFSMLCFDQSCWAEFSHRMIAAQPAESRTRISNALQGVLQGISTFDLEGESKERFYIALNRLKQEFSSFAARA